jgi:hypothetical protein
MFIANRTQLPPANTRSSTLINTLTYSRSSFIRFFIFLVLLSGLAEGILYGFFFPMVSERKYLIFRITPYNLFPTDLFIFPLAVGVAFLTASLYKSHPKVRNGYIGFLIAWVVICIQGILIGLYNGNVYLIGDVKNLALRSLFAPVLFIICSYINLNNTINKIIKIGSFFAIYIIIKNILSYIGINFESQLQPRYYLSVWPEMVMLFPYSLLVVKFLSGTQSRSADRLQLFLLALGCMSDFWKPNVAAFIICSFFAFVVVATERKFGIMKRFVRILFFVSITIIVLLAVIQLMGKSDKVITLISTNYLKENATIADLSGGRFQIIGLALQKWQRAPILGTGFGDPISGSILDAGTGTYKEFIRVYPHNYMVQMLYQLGIVGTVIFVILTILWLRRFFKTQKTILGNEKIIYKGIGVFCLTIFTVSFFSETMTSEVIGLLFWCSVGMLASIEFRSKLIAVSTGFQQPHRL